MFDRMVVHHALEKSWEEAYNPLRTRYHNPAKCMDRITSLLVYDIFGGDILKTPTKNGWHFYNRIEGKRIDFTNVQKIKSIDDTVIEDIPCSPVELFQTFEEEEYESLAVLFIRAYEKAIGLE